MINCYHPASEHAVDCAQVPTTMAHLNYYNQLDVQPHFNQNQNYQHHNHHHHNHNHHQQRYYQELLHEPELHQHRQQEARERNEMIDANSYQLLASADEQPDVAGQLLMYEEPAPASLRIGEPSSPLVAAEEEEQRCRLLATRTGAGGRSGATSPQISAAGQRLESEPQQTRSHCDYLLTGPNDHEPIDVADNRQLNMLFHADRQVPEQQELNCQHSHQELYTDWPDQQVSQQQCSADGGAGGSTNTKTEFTQHQAQQQQQQVGQSPTSQSQLLTAEASYRRADGHGNTLCSPGDYNNNSGELDSDCNQQRDNSADLSFAPLMPIALMPSANPSHQRHEQHHQQQNNGNSHLAPTGQTADADDAMDDYYHQQQHYHHYESHENVPLDQNVSSCSASSAPSTSSTSPTSSSCSPSNVPSAATCADGREQQARNELRQHQSSDSNLLAHVPNQHQYHADIIATSQHHRQDHYPVPSGNFQDYYQTNYQPNNQCDSHLTQHQHHHQQQQQPQQPMTNCYSVSDQKETIEGDNQQQFDSSFASNHVTNFASEVQTHLDAPQHHSYHAYSYHTPSHLYDQVTSKAYAPAPHHDQDAPNSTGDAHCPNGQNGLPASQQTDTITLDQQQQKLPVVRNSNPSRNQTKVSVGQAKAGLRPKSLRGRPRKKKGNAKGKVSGKLWEFIRDLLLSEGTNPSFIRWERREDGVFKFVQSDKVAKMWGERKQNPKMTYEKLSRAMRYYYKSKVLLPVFGRRLVYKFGPNATGWMSAAQQEQFNSNRIQQQHIASTMTITNNSPILVHHHHHQQQQQQQTQLHHQQQQHQLQTSDHHAKGFY